jgi:hypothetical protein
MQRIATFFVNSISATIANQFNMDQLDLVQGANAFFDQELRNNHGRIAEIEKQIKQFQKVLKRLKTKRKDNVIKTMLSHHSGSLNALIAQTKAEIEVLTEAKSILKDYTFEQEAPQYQQSVGGFFFPTNPFRGT